MSRADKGKLSEDVGLPAASKSPQACSLIDLRHQLCIAQTFFSGRLGRFVLKDAVGEVICLSDKVRRVMRVVWLVDDVISAQIRYEVLALIAEGRREFEHSLGAVYAIVSIHAGAIRGVATGDDAGGELHRPADVLFDACEASIVIDDGRVCLDIDWLLAGEVTASIERVDTYIHERASSRKCAIETPLAGGDVEPVGALDSLHVAKGTVADEFDGTKV